MECVSISSYRNESSFFHHATPPPPLSPLYFSVFSLVTLRDSSVTRGPTLHQLSVVKMPHHQFQLAVNFIICYPRRRADLLTALLICLSLKYIRISFFAQLSQPFPFWTSILLWPCPFCTLDPPLMAITKVFKWSGKS